MSWKKKLKKLGKKGWRKVENNWRGVERKRVEEEVGKKRVEKLKIIKKELEKSW